MKIILLFLISLPTYAQLDEQQCFCADPKDCEIGTVQCEFEYQYDQFQRSGIITGKFVSGDDPSPEVGSQMRVRNDLTTETVSFFAHSCTTKSFNIELNFHIWSFVEPGDFMRWFTIIQENQISFQDIPFNEEYAFLEKELGLPNSFFKVKCKGLPNQL